MLLTDYSFIIVILAFIPVYYTVPLRFQKSLLLIASLIFYAVVGIKALGLLIALSLLSFGMGLLLKQYRNKVLLWTTILLQLLPLFTMRSMQWFGNDLILPLGISFYTLQMIGYIVDIYWGQGEPERNIVRFVTTTTYFPQLVQGPFNRYVEMNQMLHTPVHYSALHVKQGLYRILWGYFKKLVIADRLVIAVSTMISAPEQFNGPYVLLLMVLYTAQLYADFSGGMDIVIGFSECLGIRMQENFDRPFAARSVTEFWRRWHISLGLWFKTYVFYPLSTSSFLLKYTRLLKKHFGIALAKRFPVYVGTLSVWALTGLWHGFAWHYLLWGLLNGMIMLIETETKRSQKTTLPLIQIVLTLFWISAIRLLDCYQSVALTAYMVTRFYEKPLGVLSDLGLRGLDVSIVLMAYGLVIYMSTKGSYSEHFQGMKPISRSLFVAFLFWSIVILGTHGIGYVPQQFIYGRF